MDIKPLLPILPLGLVLAALSSVAAEPVSAPSPVPLIQAQTASASHSLVVDAVIEPLRQSTVAAQVSGNVLQLAVKAGDTVRAGQVLARIDEREVVAGLQRSNAALAQTRAESANTQAQLARTRELRAQGFVSQAALDTAQTQAQAAAAAVQQAQAGQSQAALARGFAAVVAPFDGVVLATHLQAGDLAAPGRAIATLYAPGALRAVAQIGVSQSALARQAGVVELLLPDGRRVAPLRRTELAAADPVSQTIEWRLDLPASANESLRPGQTLRVSFAGAASAASAAAEVPRLRLPRAAVLRRGELDAVYVVDGPRFALRAVRLGASPTAGLVEVLSGLRAGEWVAADALRAGLAGARPQTAAQESAVR